MELFKIKTTGILLGFLFFINFPLFAEKCKFSYSRQKTTLGWTAFKFTEKTGVKGQLKTFDITAKPGSLNDVLSSIEFTITTSSVDTSNPERDKKIIQYFFEKLADGKTIKGKFISVEGKQKGKILARITMNGISKNVKLKYTIQDDLVTIDGKINLKQWSAETAIASLNEKCKDLHTGKDGKSILWPEVDIHIESKLDKTCS